MTGALTWLGRTAVLTLSLLATLSILGSIAAIPSGSVEGRLGLPRPQSEITTERSLERSLPAPASPGPRMPQPGSGGSQTVEAIAVPEPDERLRWLEPLTYAVIALAGLMAIAVLLLWRIVVALDARR